MNDKTMMYETMLQQFEALLENEHDIIANMANASALIFHTLLNINWAGFYLYKEHELILGPFQGNVACMHIPMGKGVCGTSALQREIMLVEDVHSFPGHIACDQDSRSEIVLPIIKEDTLLGVLDIDSPVTSRFDDADRMFLAMFVQSLIQSL